MAIDRVGNGVRAVPLQDGPDVQRGEAASLPANAELPARTSNADAAPRRSVPAAALQQVQASLAEVNRLLDGNAVAAMEQGARDGFKSLPAEYRGVALQTARLAGIAGGTALPAASFSAEGLLHRLDAVLSASSRLVETSRLDLAGALSQDPQARAEALKPHVAQLKESGHIIAAGVAQVPVAELRASREAVKEQLSTWAGQTEALHEQLKAQFGDTHPVTVDALEARTEASATFSKTMVRMALANLGQRVFDLTIGPVASGLGRFFGARG